MINLYATSLNYPAVNDAYMLSQRIFTFGALSTFADNTSTA